MIVSVSSSVFSFNQYTATAIAQLTSTRVGVGFLKPSQNPSAMPARAACDTVSHAALAGIALGFWLGFKNPTPTLVLVSCAIAVAVYWLKENTELLTDTIMALLLSGSVAVGVILLSVLKGY